MPLHGMYNCEQSPFLRCAGIQGRSPAQQARAQQARRSPWAVCVYGASFLRPVLLQPIPKKIKCSLENNLSINTILGQVNFIRILSDISVASQRAHFWELLSSSLPCTRPPDKGIIRCLQLISNDIYPYSTSANSSKDSKLIPQKSQSLCSSHTLLPFRRPEFFPSRIPPFHSRIPSDLLLLSLCT